MGAGRRDKLITIERATLTQDDYGAETPSWSTFVTEWAEVRFGNSGERREAAQEQAMVSATFAVLDNLKTRAVAPKDRIQFDGGAWNIQSNVTARQPGEREITAVRDAQP
jgi:SPP1 family predicted phage head-tail adaptor